AEISRANDVAISRADAQHQVAIRKLRHAAEEAKIELTRGRESAIFLPGLFSVDGRSIDVDVVLDRAKLEELVAPLIDRSLAVCARLLARHGVARGGLSHVVLVGGPTAMPALRTRVAELLEAPLREGLDPMTLVAQGAALHAASAGLDARPKA